MFKVMLISLLFSISVKAEIPYSVEFTTIYGNPVVIIRYEKCTKMIQVNQKDVDSGNVDKIVADLKDKAKCDAR